MSHDKTVFLKSFNAKILKDQFKAKAARIIFYSMNRRTDSSVVEFEQNQNNKIISSLHLVIIDQSVCRIQEN